MPVLDAVIQRAKTEGVKTVIVSGEIVYQDGKFTKVDRDAALRQLSELLKRPLSPDEIKRASCRRRCSRTSCHLRRLLRQRFPRSVLPAELAGLSWLKAHPARHSPAAKF